MTEGLKVKSWEGVRDRHRQKRDRIGTYWVGERDRMTGQAGSSTDNIGTSYIISHMIHYRKQK